MSGPSGVLVNHAGDMFIRRIETRRPSSIELQARFTIENKSKYVLRDPIIRCDFLGASGSTISSKTVRVTETFDYEHTHRAAWVSLGIVPDQMRNLRCDLTEVYRG